jgi:phosphate transport system protein
MQNNSEAVPGAVVVLLISRNLEKVADHATNLAEEVIFVLKGTDIRHPGLSSGS